MDLESRKILFVQEFLRLQNEDVIAGLESLLRNEKVALMESNMKAMTVGQLNHEIDQAMDDSVNGRMIKAEELLSKFEK